MSEKTYRVLNLFRHNYPVQRGEILRNTKNLDLGKLIEGGFIEEVMITPVRAAAPAAQPAAVTAPAAETAPAAAPAGKGADAKKSGGAK